MKENCCFGLVALIVVANCRKLIEKLADRLKTHLSFAYLSILNDNVQWMFFFGPKCVYISYSLYLIKVVNFS